MTDLAGQVAALAKRLNNLKLTDLPMGAIQRKLELNTPAPTSALLSDLSVQTATIAWPGGADESTVLTVPHGLGVLPRLVLVETQDQTSIGNAQAYVVAKSDQAIQFRVATFDGTQPANTVTTPISYLVIA